MGYYLEVNTLVRLPVETDFSVLGVGQKLVIQRERERLVPLHIALLFIDKDWNFYGYCRVNWLEVKIKPLKWKWRFSRYLMKMRRKFTKKNLLRRVK